MDYKETTDDETLSAALSDLIQDLPKPVRDFVTSKKRSAVALELSRKYNLHVDQAGQFEHAFTLMLVGANTPEEFLSTLASIGLSKEAVSGVATDLNNLVFIPLREAERTQAPVPTALSKPSPLPPPAIEYQAPTLPGSPVSAPMPVPATPTPVPATLEPTPVPVTPAPQQHFVHNMPTSAPQPGWHPAAAVHIFVPTQGHHAQQMAHVPAQPAPEPVHEAPVQTAPPQPQYVNPAPTPAQASQAPVSSAPIRKEYSSDPYREPVQ